MADTEKNIDIQSLRQFGKWSQPGVPHRDWRCVGEFDAIDAHGELLTCEMCEKQSIRFVHVMAHPWHGEHLNCGCVCASHMSGDSKSAEAREKRMRSRASRKKNFPSRKGWKTSARGNPNIKADGVHIVIARNRDGKFRIGSKNVWDSEFSWGSDGFMSVEEAKLAAFERYEELRTV